MSYYGIVAATGTWIILVIESYVKDETMRIFTYDRSQYMAGLACSVVNVIGLQASTVALQNEKSGLITLLGYVCIVYAFAIDTFIFKDTLIL